MRLLDRNAPVLRPRCPECRGKGSIPDTWDWLPVFLFGIVGFFLRRTETCPRCGGTGISP
jgi:DnaJ-class molecular chaperone